jgi:hypothetical protein
VKAAIRDKQSRKRHLAFERSAHLIVMVTVNQSFRARALENEVREWRKKSMPFDDYLKAPPGLFRKYENYFNGESYVRLNVKNNSNKKLTAFSFCAHSVGSAVMQIGDGDLIDLSADVPVALGDLQPKRDMVVHLLAGSFWAYSTDQLRAALVFSADELGRAKYKFPVPFHVKLRYRNWALWAFAIINALPLAVLAYLAAKN